MELLGFQARVISGQQLRGPCPIHGSEKDSRVFSVNLAKNTFQCFKCGAGEISSISWPAPAKKRSTKRPSICVNVWAGTFPGSTRDREEEPVKDDLTKESCMDLANGTGRVDNEPMPRGARAEIVPIRARE